MVDILLTIVSFLLLLGVLMFFHELGHYLVARRNGIEVEEFGVFGFPPRLVKLFTYDGTVFSLNAIPLGAFVRLKGEDMVDASPGSFNAASASARVCTLVAGPAMNFLLAILFSIASMFAGPPSMVAHPHFNDIAAGSPLQEIGLKPDDTLIRLNGVPVYINVARELLTLKQRPQPIETEAGTMVILREDALHTLDVPAMASMDLRALIAGTDPEAVLLTQITMITPDSPAEEAGLLPDDIFYTVNGEVITAERNLSEIVQEHQGETVTITLLRGDELISRQVLARQNPPSGQGAMGVGFSAITKLVSQPALNNIWVGTVNIVRYVYDFITLPRMIIEGRLAPEEAALSGPVGIARLIGGAVNATATTGLWFPVWLLAAFISASLAIVNLLPLPALDGGRLLFIAIEKLRGQRIAPEKEGTIHLVGFILLLGLMVFVTISDIRSGPPGIDWSRILGQ